MLGNHLASSRSDIVQIGIPELQQRSPPEPSIDDEESVDDTSGIIAILASCRLGCCNHSLRDDGRIGFRDLEFLDFAGDDGFNLMLQSQGGLCDELRVECGGKYVTSILGQY